MMRKIFLLIVVAYLSVPAWAQSGADLEVGLKGGVGDYSSAEDSPGGRGVVGVEVCAFCAGKYALFGDYQHFFRPDNTRTSYKSAESFSAGLRIQGNRKVNPFFDVGVGVGKNRFGLTSLTTVGAAFGTGLRIPLGERAYVRPQLRLHVLSHGYLLGSAEVAVGWRF